MQDFTDAMRQYLDYYFSQVHTSTPGRIVEYNYKTRRAVVQPCLKRRVGNKDFVALPMLIDVPVQFPATKKYIIHIPLEENDEVAIFFSERCLEEWKKVGQDGIEDKDPRRYALSDAYCAPGLQPQEFLDVPEKGLIIKHKTKWDGDFISHVHMDDDHIELKYKKKSKVLMEDDKIECTTEGNKVLMTGKHVDVDSPNPIGIKGTGVLLGADVLQVFWDELSAAWDQYKVFIPPVPWPSPVVPPAPPIINMALTGVKAKVMAACAKAKLSGAKSIK
jgi:hypothetical protein